MSLLRVRSDVKGKMRPTCSLETRTKLDPSTSGPCMKLIDSCMVELHLMPAEHKYTLILTYARLLAV
jgi:hypothetical protein